MPEKTVRRWAQEAKRAALWKCCQEVFSRVGIHSRRSITFDGSPPRQAADLGRHQAPIASENRARTKNWNWKLKTQSSKLRAGSWQLEAGSWKLGAGSWKLETESSQLEARSSKLCRT